MTNKFLKKYFNSLNKDEDELTAFQKKIQATKGAISDKELELFENKTPSSFKGSISDKEVEELKKLLSRRR
jgi:type 1 glutamine amidotransferase